MVKSSKSETAPAQVAAPAKTAEKAPKTPKAEKTAEKAPKAEKVAATPAPVVEAATETKPKAAKKQAAPKKEAAAAPVAVAVAAPVEGATEVAAAGETASVSSEFTEFMAKLQQLGAVVSSLKTEFRSLEKKASRELKTAAKASHKRKRKTGNRSPSGFVKPTLISDELAAFLGKGKGTQMARTEVTREINAYIRANQLQDKTNGRRINADTNLASLLKLASGEELTYFNLQRYMSPHFAKSAAVVATA
jgi:chromatin remodeling complex protein RSC6